MNNSIASIEGLPCIAFTTQTASGNIRFIQIAGGALLQHGLQADDCEGFLAAIHPDDIPKFIHSNIGEVPLIRLYDKENGKWLSYFLHHGDNKTTGGILTPATGQQSLIDDAQRYCDYAEMSSDWYWEQDEEFRFTHLSHEFEEVTGVPCAQALGKTRWHGIGKERLSNIDWAAHEQSLREHQPFRNLEYPTRRADGKVVWVRVSGKPRFDNSGKFTGYFGVASDISASKKMESHLHQSERLATVGQLAAGMAHEINNPVGFVRSNIETLDKYLHELFSLVESASNIIDKAGPQPETRIELQKAIQAADFDFLREDAPQLIEECRSGLDRVRKIVAELREFAHEGEAKWIEADIHHCLESALSILSGQLSEHIKISQNLARLPLIHCRPAQINQVALALLTNAIQALAEHGGSIDISTGQDDDSHVWFEIRDNGCGIKPEIMPRIFEPFFTTRQVGKGTGMGLASCFGIISEHGGHIDANSTLGSGSCFRVTLPAKSPLNQSLD